MRGCLLWFLVLLALANAGAAAETISDADRSYLVSHLEMTREFVIDATRGLTNEQWLFTPAPKRWSIAQCIDHLASTEEYVLRMVRERLLQAAEPIEPFPSLGRRTASLSQKPERMPAVADALIIRAMTDRTPALALPLEQRPPVEEVAPRNSFPDSRSALEHFRAVRAATLEYARNTRDDLRGHFSFVRLEGFYPQFKFHDGYQWLLRMSAHTERHLAQVHEIKGNHEYPERNDGR